MSELNIELPTNALNELQTTFDELIGVLDSDNIPNLPLQNDALNMSYLGIPKEDITQQLQNNNPFSDPNEINLAIENFNPQFSPVINFMDTMFFMARYEVYGVFEEETDDYKYASVTFDPIFQKNQSLVLLPHLNVSINPKGELHQKLQNISIEDFIETTWTVFEENLPVGTFNLISENDMLNRHSYSLEINLDNTIYSINLGYGETPAVNYPAAKYFDWKVTSETFPVNSQKDFEKVKSSAEAYMKIFTLIKEVGNRLLTK